MPHSDSDVADPLMAHATARPRQLPAFWPSQEGSVLRTLPDQNHTSLPIPDYLLKHYWWAYVDPRAVRLFERQWLIDFILMRHYNELAMSALDDIDITADASVLQVACAYGDITPNLVRKLRDAGARLDVIDVLPIQLENLSRKLAPSDPVRLWQMDSRKLEFADNSVDCVLLFFLMHEQPDVVRRQTLAEAHRVLRPGGKMVIVDYAQPSRGHLLRLPLRLILPKLEPFFLDLWTDSLSDWMPQFLVTRIKSRDSFFDGLYQKISIVK